MVCERCGGDNDRTDEKWDRLVFAESTRIDAPWCRECENQYDRWVRDYAADIVWQTGIGASVAIVIGMVLPLLGLPPIIGIAGVLVGFSTFMGLRTWGKARRRRQFLTASLPRAYLPKQT